MGIYRACGLVLLFLFYLMLSVLRSPERRKQLRELLQRMRAAGVIKAAFLLHSFPPHVTCCKGSCPDWPLASFSPSFMVGNVLIGSWGRTRGWWMGYGKE
jgi:hypothetical protein